LPIFLLSCAGMVVLARKDKETDAADPIDERNLDSDVPDAIHIAPRD